MYTQFAIISKDALMHLLCRETSKVANLEAGSR